jgi:hypothetical protein
VFGRSRLWEQIGDELVVDTRKFVSLGRCPGVETPDGLAAALPDNY